MDAPGDIMVQKPHSAKKIFDSVSLAHHYKDAHEFSQELGASTYGPVPSSRGNKYILVAVDYLCQRWVKVEERSPTNDARVVKTGASCRDKLDDALGAYRTAYKNDPSGVLLTTCVWKGMPSSDRALITKPNCASKASNTSNPNNYGDSPESSNNELNELRDHGL
ncbi:hypothetical protein Tco_0140835 [Tanacetum coccineum]|uniref:Uncharacterized protein n=1 Tax=Tanacetum coccineum TaxID=301880 RepID=A0ABQ4WWI8_9ASTR